jgi:hypothetical protein
MYMCPRGVDIPSISPICLLNIEPVPKMCYFSPFAITFILLPDIVRVTFGVD